MKEKMAISKINTSAGPDGKQQATTSNARLRRWTIVFIIVGIVCILIFSCNITDLQKSLIRIGSSFSLAIGAIVLGCLLGFIFGIPRTLQHDIAPRLNGGIDKPENIGYQINTNLEQISDWLTKIIIGVGLIEIGSIGSWLMNFSNSVGKSFDETQMGQIYILGLLVSFSGGGFMLGYLWTRLSFGLAIKEADQGLLERRIEKFEADIRADHQALLAATRQLTPSRGETGLSQEELNSAIRNATEHTRIKIFHDAVAARRDQKRAENAIAVFNALIGPDTAEKVHQLHANLGYSLKDKLPPDWDAAEKSLTKAIEVRDRAGEHGWGAYEFNRALCRIHLDRPVEEIVLDLKEAAKDKWVREWSFDDRLLIDWLRKNQISRQSLGFS
ncbi:MAG: hypothetical protein WAS21_32410 [Geminicoccaceae bacterium]